MAGATSRQEKSSATEEHWTIIGHNASPKALVEFWVLRPKGKPAETYFSGPQIHGPTDDVETLEALAKATEETIRIMRKVKEFKI